MRIATAFLAGLLFGLGLLLSGMTDPSKVIGFLNVAGKWEPSMAFVMSGAILVSYFAFRLAGKRDRSWLGETILLPSATKIDRRLVLGGLVFGTGWGLAGICPGPALVSLGRGDSEPFVFVAAMLVGMGMYELYERCPASRMRDAG
ncbi:YeeE/YedE family protein [Noviherbaspirillum saxi]|uniref:YeeE/YedE family protein n=1 Tax=Noviherbaspirillum saxi TaxID=2320863 RepID=A0A3A3G133_9BURK|nr:YeeE/YedE family protein [Noviherbaspirillum saxi]RJF91783.1 YeeE/YedE family protein [Noviherbaspirillum saxi]